MMETIDLRWIAARLTGARGEKARLAEALGVSPDQVAKMLAGVRRVQTGEIPKLLAFFCEDRLLVTPAERRLVENYRLAPEGRREAVEVLLSVPPSP